MDSPHSTKTRHAGSATVPAVVDDTVPQGYLDAATPVLVIMGVSGCGKTTMNEHLGSKLGWDMAEADDFHPQANIDKMAHGLGDVYKRQPSDRPGPMALAGQHPQLDRGPYTPGCARDRYLLSPEKDLS